MPHGRGRAVLAVLGCALSVAVTHAQAPVAPVQVAAGLPTDLPAALSRLAARAAVVFVGTVKRIDRVPGVVEVTLEVEQVLQGQPGSEYLLREWAGSWPPGLQRYTVGQRSLFFLNAPGASGLSFPVESAGVVPVRGDPETGAVLDVRHLNATLLRGPADKLSEINTMSLEQAAQAIQQGSVPGQRRPPSSSGENPRPIVVQGTGSARVQGGLHGAQ